MAIINVFLGYREFAGIEQIKTYINANYGIDFNEDIANAEVIILFETSRQKTWLITTEKRMFCVLDDVEQENFTIKWSLEKENIVTHNQFTLNLKTDSSYKPKTGLIDFGPEHKAWLYSKKLYPTDTDLKNKIQKVVSHKMLTTESYHVAQY